MAKADALPSVVAIAAIAVLEYTAMMQGIDGAALAGGLAAIGALGGYGARRRRAPKVKEVPPVSQ